ncbi:hypothetical protein AK812_SmicGene47521, partial [Symbiodinium microadriaticum]
GCLPQRSSSAGQRKQVAWRSGTPPPRNLVAHRR